MLTIKSYAITMVSPFVPPASRLPRWLLASVALVAVGAIPVAALLAQIGKRDALCGQGDPGVLDSVDQPLGAQGGGVHLQQEVRSPL